MGDPHAPAISVRGGAGSIDAHYDDIERLGGLYSTTGHRLVGWGWDDKLEAADGDLLASAVLSPDTFEEAESAVLDATLGPGGLIARAASVEAQSWCFTAVVEIYRTTDELRHAAMESLCYGLGFAVGYHLPELLVAGGLVYGGLHLVSPELAGRTRAELVAGLEDHPRVLESLLNGGGGLLDGMSADPLTAPMMRGLGLDGFHPDTGSAADDLGELLFSDYEGGLDADYRVDAFDHRPPRHVADLLESLGAVAADDVPNGVITIQRLTGTAGEASYVVQLPGTDDFLSDTEIRNMGSNLNLIAGDDTAYGEAIRHAMQAAGVHPEAPVMLVGHSQGGMQAAALAADPDFGYHVTHVVTAGSPVATSGIPDDVSVLSLENSGDVVPLLDGEPNPASANHTTVRADVHTGSLGAEDGQNHSLSTYGSIASSVDASGDPALVGLVGGMRDRGFLADAGESVASETWSYRTRSGEQVRPADLGNPLAWTENLIP